VALLADLNVNDRNAVSQRERYRFGRPSRTSCRLSVPKGYQDITMRDGGPTGERIGVIAAVMLVRQFEHRAGPTEQAVHALHPGGGKVFAIVFARKRDNGVQAISQIQRDFGRKLVCTFRER